MIMKVKPGMDLRNQDLSHSDFQYVNLQGSNLENAILKETNFTGANLRYVNFENADLTNVNFENADLTGVNFKNANLNGSIFLNSIIHDVNLYGTILDKSETQNEELIKKIEELQLEVEQLKKYKEFYDEFKSKCVNSF